MGVPRDVWLLGIVSFLTDVSSEMIFAVFALFFTLIIGGTTAALGIIEGLADFSASSLDYLAGWLSDKTGKRKPLALLGYSFSTASKVLLMFATSVGSASVFRVVERLGKSFRGPPRDAWLAAVAPEKNRGLAFGVHKALDKAGAVLGPLIGYALLQSFGTNASTFHTLFIVALVPAVLSLIVLAFVREKKTIPRKRENIFTAFQTLSPAFKRYLIPAGAFALAYFSFAFLLLRAYQLGFSVADVVLLYALFNASFVITSPLAGKLGDLIGRKYIIPFSYLVYLLMCVGFVFATQHWHVIALFLVYGVFYAIDEGQTKAFISDLEQKRRGTAIGAYNFIAGLLYVLASLIAGALWLLSPALAFEAAAGLSALALVLFFAVHPQKN